MSSLCPLLLKEDFSGNEAGQWKLVVRKRLLKVVNKWASKVGIISIMGQRLRPNTDF